MLRSRLRCVSRWNSIYHRVFETPKRTVSSIIRSWTFGMEKLLKLAILLQKASKECVIIYEYLSGNVLIRQSSKETPKAVEISPPSDFLFMKSYIDAQPRMRRTHGRRKG